MTTASAATTMRQRAELVRQQLQQHPEWSDEKRMRALCASMPAYREVHPIAWQDKFQFWNRVLVSLTKQALLDGEDRQHASSVCVELGSVDGGRGDRSQLVLERLLAWNGITPRCLKHVLMELYASGKLQSREELFLGGRRSSATGFAIQWAVQQASAWSRWGWRQLVSSVMNDDGQEFTQDVHLPGENQLIFVELLQELCQNLLEELQRNVHYYTDTLLSVEEIAHRFAHRWNLKDIQLALDYMATQGRLQMSADKKAVKLPYRGTQPLAPWNETDEGIANLKRAYQSIHRQLELLEMRAQSCHERARLLVQKGQKTSALLQLQQKKSLEKTVQRHAQSLQNLDAVMMRLQASESDAEIVNAYRQGSDALTRMLKESNLSVESVEQAVDQLQDAIADQNEIDAAMEAGNTAIMSQVNPETDEELERELDQLLMAEVEEEQARMLAALPSVPTQPLPAAEPAVPASTTTRLQSPRKQSILE